MKNKIYLTILLLAGFAGFSGFQNDKASLALEEVKVQFTEGMDSFEKEIQELIPAVEALGEEKISQERLREAILETRLAYKKIEFLVAYLDEQNVIKKINGAPLPKLEPHVPELSVIEPVGLQVLDEMIFAEDVLDTKEEILELAVKLKRDFADLRAYQDRIPLNHRYVFEAFRRELIRVFTLGLTGFDTPGSANAIPEAKAAMEGIYAALKSYMPLIEERDRGLAIVMDARIPYTLEYLTINDDFETFDRMEFYKSHIQPQYQIFYELHKRLGIEFVEEVSDLPSAVNYHSVGIFEKDFLNADYYANLNFEEKHTQERRELGRLLFFDPILSSNNERACASCHQAEKAFTDGLAKSLATDGKGDVGRNAQTLVNSVYSDKYFWDIREHRLDRQMQHVVESDKEFNTDYLTILEKLGGSEEYKNLFAAAYPEHPDYQLSTYTVSDALSHYVASLTDLDSDFDKYMRGEWGTYAPDAYRGFNLFMGKAACGTCHFAPMFNGSVPPLFEESESEVLGVPTEPVTTGLVLDSDQGRFASKIQSERADFYKNSFKTVTVRNAELTAPYMHNGVYNTLEEVVDFYNRGGGSGMGLDLPHQTLPFSELNLSTQEQADLVAFMKTLTGDMSKFSAPEKLPSFQDETLDARTIGGNY